uniref:Si:dkey-19b23.12 n=1 Tax=Stegastes partitus TaxID=144197 RepID=A0A3B5AGN4_9TELE
MSNNRFIRRLLNTPQPSAPTLVCTKSLFIILPVVQIAVGAIYLHDCPRKQNIPIYLIVVGVFGLVLAVLSCLPWAQDSNDGTSSPLNQLCKTWNSLVSCFLFSWFIAGNVWIYSIYQPNYNKTITSVPYCDKTLYLFAFWSTTVTYILLAVALLVSCLYVLCGNSNSDNNV